MARSPRWRPKRRLAGAIVQFGSFVVILGIPDGLLGVLWPTLRRSMHRPLADLGELVVAGTVLYLLGGLVGDRIRRQLGLRGTLLAATLIGLGSLLGWALAPRWWVVIVSVALLGLVKGVLDAVLNAEATIDGGVRRLGLLHASWAIGGTLGPVLVATLAAGGDWRAAVGVVAAAAAVLIPFAAMSPGRHLPEGADGATPPEEVGPSRAPAPRRPGSKAWLGIAVTTLAFAAYTMAEAGPVSWGTTYLLDYRHLSTTAAAAFMAVFWAALTLGRLSLALPHRFKATRVLEASCLLFVAGMALLWLLPGRLAVIGLPVAGLGSATIFPLYMALTPVRLGEEVTGRAVGFSIAGAAVGGPIGVSIFGVLAAHLGTGVLGPCLFGASVLMYLGHRLLAAVTAAGSRPLAGPAG